MDQMDLAVLADLADQMKQDPADLEDHAGQVL